MSGRIEKLIARNRAANRGAHLYEDAEWMREAYVERRLSLREVAAEAQCSLRTAARWMAVHGIGTRTSAEGIGRGVEHHSWKGGMHGGVCPTCGARRHRQSRGATCLQCRDRSGVANSNWRGDEIGTTQAHQRVRNARGPASAYRCELCEKKATGWAYDHSDPEEKIDDRQGPYSLDVYRYVPMCSACHKVFDVRYLRSVGRLRPESLGVDVLTTSASPPVRPPTCRTARRARRG